MKRTILLLSITVLYQLPIVAQLYCNEPTAKEQLDHNYVDATIVSSASLFGNKGNSSYEVPKVSPSSGDPSVHSFFTSGFWISGLKDGLTPTTAVQYYDYIGSDYVPGPLGPGLDIINDDYCNLFDRVWKVNQAEIDDFISNLNNGEITEAAQIPEAIRNWPGRNNPHFDLFELPIDKDLAPFHDVNNDGNFNPLDGDKPRINGAQGLWKILHDVIEHEVTAGEPIGIEVSVLAYSFPTRYSLDLLGHQTFYEVEIKNQSLSNFSDFYCSLFIDVDLGNFDDDYIGSLPDEDLGFVYNADELDEGVNGYGTDIPVAGIKFYKGLSDQNGQDKGMSNFVYFTGDFTSEGKPTELNDFFNFQRSKTKTGNIFTHADLDNPFHHYYGNPANPNSESECSKGNTPADRRFVASSGPVDFNIGDSQTVHLGILWTPFVTYPCPDISPLVELADEMGEYLDENVFNPNATGIDPARFANQEAVLYPNPTTENVVFIDTEINLANTQAQFFNSAGQEVFSTALNTTNRIDLPATLQQGVYQVLIHKDSQVISASRLLLIDNK